MTVPPMKVTSTQSRVVANRWPIAAVIVVAIGLQLALPDWLALQFRWLLPGLELAMLIELIIASPVRFNRESTALRVASLTLTGLLSLANAWSATLLILGLIRGTEGEDVGALLSTGAAIWLTNIIAFAGAGRSLTTCEPMKSRACPPNTAPVGSAAMTMRSKVSTSIAGISTLPVRGPLWHVRHGDGVALRTLWGCGVHRDQWSGHGDGRAEGPLQGRAGGTLRLLSGHAWSVSSEQCQ
ncbi:MAG: hypothetical protein ACRDRU_15580 [Pseudonocardiaceae bacterium]